MKDKETRKADIEEQSQIYDIINKNLSSEQSVPFKNGLEMIKCKNIYT